MAGDVVFNNATVTMNVSAVNVYGNPAEVSQRLDQIVSAVNSLQERQMATAQELMDGIDELGAQIEAFQSAANNAEARITAAIKAGQDGAALQAVVDSAFAKVKDLGGKAKAAADDLNDGTDEADVPPDTGGGDTTGDGDTGTGGDTGSGDTPPTDDGTSTLRRR